MSIKDEAFDYLIAREIGRAIAPYTLLRKKLALKSYPPPVYDNAKNKIVQARGAVKKVDDPLAPGAMASRAQSKAAIEIKSILGKHRFHVVVDYTMKTKEVGWKNTKDRRQRGAYGKITLPITWYKKVFLEGIGEVAPRLTVILNATKLNSTAYNIDLYSVTAANLFSDKEEVYGFVAKIKLPNGVTSAIFARTLNEAANQASKLAGKSLAEKLIKKKGKEA